MQKSKNAFTMIELIFVIVILGILAAVVIPRLAATRGDAKVASEVSNASIALQNLGSEFTARGAFTNYTVNDADNTVECFTFTLNSAVDGNITLAPIGASSPTCSTQELTAVINLASINGLIATDGSSKTYIFASTGVVE